MRYFYALSLLLALGLGRSAHAQQPFLKYGVKVKVATLSNGRFQEFFTNDSLRRIGSVVYDTRLHRVAYLLPPDSLVGHAKPDITSRWISPDPLAEKYLYSTPYAFADNNPIRYNDPDGREFTDPAKKRVDAYGKEIQSRITDNNSKIAGLKSKLEAGGLSDKQTARANRQIGRFESSNNDYQAIQGELATLSASSQVYDIQEVSQNNIPGLPATFTGETTFDNSSGVVRINLPSNMSGFSLISHELKHAYQFEMGQYSIGPAYPNFPYSNILYDKTDEVAAYARGSLFGQTAWSINSLPVDYNNVARGPYDINNVPGISASLGARNQALLLQNFANNTGHAFRVGGQTYYRKKQP